MEASSDKFDDCSSNDSVDNNYNYNNESEEEQNEDEIFHDNDFRSRQPIYRGALITVGESMILILCILLYHNVTYSCLSDIISIINLHCLNDQLKKNSLFKFQKYFSLNKTEFEKHYYCNNCLRPLESADSICPSCPSKRNSYFITLPFIEQLKELYKRNEFYNDLQWRFNRPVPQPEFISDIFDGSVYKNWMDNGFLLNPNNITLSWYTDGIPVFKSAKISAWPLYLTINELPFQMRKKRKIPS